MTSAIELLTPIWQRVLRRNTIGIDENFFEMGGNPKSASALFEDIARSFGRDLSVLTIYQAPTIASLAATLECSDQPRLETAVPLLAGSAGEPIFFEHGLGGSVVELFQLLKNIETRRPIYGLQMKGIDGLDRPLDRIEEIAEFHLKTIRRMQPEGAYTIVGYSLGGLIAFEMARMLLKDGFKVSLLVMVDSYPDVRYLPFEKRIAVMARRLKRNAFKRIGGSAGSRKGGGAPARVQFSPFFAGAMQAVSDSANRALLRYQPPSYKGHVKFVKAAIPTDFPDDPTGIWSRLTGGFDVQTVPGDHFGLLAGYAPRLGQVLSKYFQEATEQ